MHADITSFHCLIAQDTGLPGKDVVSLLIGTCAGCTSQYREIYFHFCVYNCFGLILDKAFIAEACQDENL